jgi:hypothetical protein
MAVYRRNKLAVESVADHPNLELSALSDKPPGWIVNKKFRNHEGSMKTRRETRFSLIRGCPGWNNLDGQSGVVD